MPIYEYKCQDCEHSFEELVMGSSEVLCPECGSSQVDKQASAFAFKAGPRGGGIDAATALGPFAGGGDFSGGEDMGGACGTCGSPDGPGSC